MVIELESLLEDVKACTICVDKFQHDVRPILQLSAQSKILIAGQAPGLKAHDSGIPFDDASGKRLRNWMGINNASFYDSKLIAILPMSFCFPGTGKSGDLAPPIVCAQTWRKKILQHIPNIQLILVIGQYAQKWHLTQSGKNLTETVRAWQSYDTNIMPLPHPSPRNNNWLKKNSWFESDVLPTLKERVQRILS